MFRDRQTMWRSARIRRGMSVDEALLPSDFSSTLTSVPIFHYRTDDFIYDLRERQHNGHQNGDAVEKKRLSETIAERWENARTKNVLNYNLNCLYKYLDGPYNLTIQLNIERGELRRKPMRFRHIQEAFNPVRWNFTRINDNEVLIYLKCEDYPLSEDPLDRNVLAVNASPLERNHSLLIPALNKCHPQVLTRSALRIAVDFLLLHDDENEHILFNSLLGQASINHLHLHALPWPYESDLINRRFEYVPNVTDAFVIRPPDWICQAFAFQLTGKEDFEKFIDQLTMCVNLLISHEQAHNVSIGRAPPIRTDGPLREEDRRGEKPLYLTAYIFPRMNMMGAKPPTNFNPAANELAGCLTSYTMRFFESVNEHTALRIIQDEAHLPEHVFNTLVSDLSDTLLGKKVAAPKPPPLPEGLTSPELDELRDSFSSFDPPSPSRINRRRAGSAEQTALQIPEIILS